MAPSHGRTPPPTYLERLRTELDALRRTYKEILTDSQIHNVDPNRSASAIFFVGAVQWDWAASDGALEQKRMALLGKALLHSPDLRAASGSGRADRRRRRPPDTESGRSRCRRPL